MRTQRRPAVTATLVHVVQNNLGAGDVTTSTVITGAVFEPAPQPVERVDQAPPTYQLGAFNLPGVHTAEAGDTLLVNGAEWRVLSGGTVWLDRTRVPVATGTMPDRVSLRVPGGTGPTWNESTHRSEVIPFAPFAVDVPARVQARSRAPGSELLVADDLVPDAHYLVSLPMTGTTGVDSIVVDGENDTLIDVTASPDPLLVGKTLRTVAIVLGSHRFERVLLCTLNE